jgi:hypothetical protein
MRMYRSLRHTCIRVAPLPVYTLHCTLHLLNEILILQHALIHSAVLNYSEHIAVTVHVRRHECSTKFKYCRAPGAASIVREVNWVWLVTCK